MKLLALLTFLFLPPPAQDLTYLVLQKAASSLAYYTPEGKVMATVPVGQHPHEMAFSPDRRYLYVTDNGTMRIEHAGKGGNTISIIDVAARKKAGKISLGEYHRPHGIAVDSKTGRLAVSVELPDQLLLVDPVKKSILKTFDTQGKTAHMVTFGPDAKWAYVSNSSSGNVAAINLESGETKLIATAERPEGSVLSKDGKELYVANREASSISVIDTSQQRVTGNIQTGKGPVRIDITPDGSTLVYALMHDRMVGFADAKARKQTGLVKLGGQPVSLHLSRDGNLAFASAEEQDTVYVISVPDRKLVREIKTRKGSGPDPVMAIGAK
ncbi:MAG: YncE family protein [Bryobacteraceae bacterium]